MIYSLLICICTILLTSYAQRVVEFRRQTPTCPDHQLKQTETGVWDILHEHFPAWRWTSISDVVLLCQFILYIIACNTNQQSLLLHSDIYLRTAILFVLRFIVNYVTQLPSPVQCPRPIGSPTMTDLAISGHTILFVVLAETTCGTASSPLKWISRLLVFVGAISSTMTREHYTSDVLLAAFLAYTFVLKRVLV